MRQRIIANIKHIGITTILLSYGTMYDYAYEVYGADPNTASAVEDYFS